MRQVPSEVGKRMCKGDLVEPRNQVFSEVKFTLGLDLAKANDFTALSVLENQLWESERCSLCFELHRYRCLGVVRMERVPRGTTYPAIVERVAAVMRSRQLLGRCRVVIDATGVGAPVVDAIAEERDLPYMAVVLTGGNDVKIQNKNYATASKVALVSRLAADLQDGALSVAPGAPGVELLGAELAELRRKVSAAGRVSMEAAPGEHDDLVMSLSLANWFGQWEPARFGFRGDVRLV